ncbi:uncharacterized protein JN550_003579 [Neoarthrinium moseri]|uniref:uncharacterized protein n=1 Tax=Neoarthrinium moseri TaxID=1658444 RepID=UPI001FDDD07F|nr:uncharacterized protein JN550_003579 [Neoarthrinium moseri]KAI1873326.1 hypothetical protein JN550_003579 [Neoarthrinium moseri]
MLYSQLHFPELDSGAWLTLNIMIGAPVYAIIGFSIAYFALTPTHKWDELRDWFTWRVESESFRGGFALLELLMWPAVLLGIAIWTLYKKLCHRLDYDDATLIDLESQKGETDEGEWETATVYGGRCDRAENLSCRSFHMAAFTSLEIRNPRRTCW